MFRLRRTLVIAAAAVGLGLALAACEAGYGATTSRPFAPTDGASTVLHDISIRNVFVLGARPGQMLPAGGSAGMFLALVNSGAPDQLLSISAPGTAASVKLPRQPLPLTMQQPRYLTGPVPEVILQKLAKPLVNGSWITMTLNFQNAGSITINVPVVARSQSYSTFSPPASPTPAGRRTARPAPGGTARPTAGTRTASPSVSPSASP